MCADEYFAGHKGETRGGAFRRLGIYLGGVSTPFFVLNACNNDPEFTAAVLW